MCDAWPDDLNDPLDALPLEELFTIEPAAKLCAISERHFQYVIKALGLMAFYRRLGNSRIRLYPASHVKAVRAEVLHAGKMRPRRRERSES